MYHFMLNSYQQKRRQNGGISDLLLLLCLALALLVSDAAAGLASGLARGLALAAAAVLSAVAKILGLQSLDGLHYFILRKITNIMYLLHYITPFFFCLHFLKEKRHTSVCRFRFLRFIFSLLPLPCRCILCFLPRRLSCIGMRIRKKR